MIQSFKCKETEKIYHRNFSKKLPHDIQRNAMKKLWMLDAAPDINSLRVPPSNHLELLKGDREGQYSIRIINNGEFVLNGNLEMHLKLRLQIIIKGV